MAAPLCVPTNRAQGFSFLHILTNTCYLGLLMAAILMGMRWYLTVALLIFYLFIYLFMTTLGLRFCARASSSCGKPGPLFIMVRGPLTIMASLVAEHRLQTRRLSSCGSRA